MYRLSLFLHTLLRSFPTPRLTDFYGIANGAKLNSTNVSRANIAFLRSRLYSSLPDLLQSS